MLHIKKYSGKTGKNTGQSFKIILLTNLRTDTHREGLIILTWNLESKEHERAREEGDITGETL